MKMRKTFSENQMKSIRKRALKKSENNKASKEFLANMRYMAFQMEMINTMYPEPKPFKLFGFTL